MQRNPAQAGSPAQPFQFMNYYNVIVIGAGPSGMMAALRAAEITDSVALFEKNASLGRKLGLTGKGRCNITNVSGLDVFLEKFGKKGLFLRNVFNKFFVDDLIRFFKDRGLEVKTERQGRVFPATDRSISVIDVFKKAMAKAGVDVCLSSSVHSVKVFEDGIKRVCFTDGKEVFAKTVIIATGGVSYPQTGSTGDGLRIARELGHRIEEASGGLVPLETQESFVRDVQGLTLKNIRITFFAGNKKIESSIGELLFTHFGVSGPLILDISSDICKLLKKSKVRMLIDLKPGLEPGQLNIKMQREFQVSGSLMIKNYLADILPNRLVAVVLRSSKVSGEKKCHQITAPERSSLVSALKALELTITRPRPIVEAMVTEGGVSLNEINPQTMESRKAKGVYFCGEVLDLAAASGGFNLQAAFSTGYLAGESAASKVCD